MSAIYGMLKKQKSLFLVSASGVLFFFFLVVLLSKVQNDYLIPLYSEEYVMILSLFFILVFCFIEYGLISIFLNNVLDKMASNSDQNNKLIINFNRVSNRIIFYTSSVLGFCYFISIFLIWNNSYSLFFNSEGIMGFNFGSVYGILFLTFITLSGAIIFWFFFPREKIKPLDNF